MSRTSRHEAAIRDQLEVARKAEQELNQEIMAMRARIGMLQHLLDKADGVRPDDEAESF